MKPGRFLALHGNCSECSQLIQHAQCSLLRNLQLIRKHQFVFLMIDEMKLVLTWNNNDRLLFIKKDQIFKQLIINSTQRFVFNHPCIDLDNKYILIINYVLVKKYWIITLLKIKTTCVKFACGYWMTKGYVYILLGTHKCWRDKVK